MRSDAYGASRSSRHPSVDDRRRAGALGDKRALLLSHHGLLVASSSVEEACVLSIAFERAARMQLLASGSGAVQPIDPRLGREAHDWILRPKRNAIAFDYYARRALKNLDNADCLRPA